MNGCITRRHPDAEALRRADQRAQRRFRLMVNEQTYADPTNRHTRLYVEAERLLDRLRVDTSDPDYLAVSVDWRLSALTGEYTLMPDIPLAGWAPGEVMEAWGK